jgi:hypothetical protein
MIAAGKMQRPSSGGGDGPTAKLRRISRACEPCRIRKDRVGEAFGRSDISAMATSPVILAWPGRGNVPTPRQGRNGGPSVKLSNSSGMPQGYKKSLEERLYVYETALCHLSGSLPGQVDSAIRDLLNDPQRVPSEAALQEWRNSPTSDLLMQLSGAPRPNGPSPIEKTEVFTPQGLPPVPEPPRLISIHDSPDFSLFGPPATDFSSATIEADLG